MIFCERNDFMSIFSIWRRDQSAPILNMKFWISLIDFKMRFISNDINSPYDNTNIFLISCKIKVPTRNFNSKNS